MNLIKHFNFWILRIFLICYPALVWASSGQIKTWGENTVRQGQSIGLSWMSAALVICGFLSLLGLQFAQGMLAKILMGSGLIFGASALASFLQGIFR